MSSRFEAVRFSMRRLRHGGARLLEERIGPYSTMYFRATREGGVLALYATISPGGPPSDILYEPKLLRAETDGWVMQGIERDGDAAFVQEWELRVFRPIM